MAPRRPRTPWILAALALLLGAALAAADEPPAPFVYDRIHLTNGSVLEGSIRAEDDERVTLDLACVAGGSGSLEVPRSRIARIERAPERARAFASPETVRDATYLLRSGAQAIGTRRLIRRYVRTTAGAGWRLEEHVVLFARGPHVPATRVLRAEDVDLVFRPRSLHYREVGEGSADADGPRRYERTVFGRVESGFWRCNARLGVEMEQRDVALEEGVRGRLGTREHLLRRRELGVRDVVFLDPFAQGLVRARAGYVALDAADAAGERYDEFVWEEAGVRLVSRFREGEVLEEAVAEHVAAVPATPAQLEAAEAAGQARDPSLVRLADVGVAFRLPDVTWTGGRTDPPHGALGWRKVAYLESPRMVATVRVEWDPAGVREAPEGAEALDRLLHRLRTVCPDLEVVEAPRPVARLAPAWRVDLAGTLKGSRVRTAVLVMDRGDARIHFLAAVPETGWSQAAPSVEMLFGSVERL